MKTLLLISFFFTGVFIVEAHATLKDLAPFKTKDFLLSTAATGCMPKGVKVDPIGQYLFVAEMCGKFDLRTKTRVPTASIFDMSTHTLSSTLITLSIYFWKELKKHALII